MTGNCENRRSLELINKCSGVRYNDSIKETTSERTNYRNYSPIEMTLWCATDEDIKNMADYLCDRTELKEFDIANWEYRNKNGWDRGIIMLK